MATKQHFEILKRGVNAWNEWRRENSCIKPKLRGAILFGMDLSTANLGEADLHEAILSGANLSSANLIRADLSMEHEFYSDCFSQLANQPLLDNIHI